MRKPWPSIKVPMTQTKMAVELMGWTKEEQYRVHRYLARLFTTAEKGKPDDKGVRTIYKNMVKAGDFSEFVKCYANLNRELIPKHIFRQYTNQKQTTLDRGDRSDDDEDEE